MPPELAFAPDPLFDELVAKNSGVRAGPHLAGRDVRDLADERVVPIALDDRALVPVGEWRFVGREKSRSQQNAVATENERSRDPGAVGDAARHQDRYLRHRAYDHP